MTPSVPDVLLDLAGRIAAAAAPEADPADRAATLGLSALLLSLAAEAWDGAAHNLVQENRALHALLLRGATLVPPPAAGDEADLRISALAAENRRLRAALITLQIAAEAQDRALNEAIWAELAASAERRKTAGSAV